MEITSRSCEKSKGSKGGRGGGAFKISFLRYEIDRW